MENQKLGLEMAFGTQDFAGMSKRFYAACAAMQGILSSYAGFPIEKFPYSWIAESSYAMADELLKQENQ